MSPVAVSSISLPPNFESLRYINKFRSLKVRKNAVKRARLLKRGHFMMKWGFWNYQIIMKRTI